MTKNFALALTVLAGCMPSINQAAKTSLDRRIADLTMSARQVAAPAAATPQPLAVGQWVTLRQTDREQRPSLSTYKIVGAEDSAFWLEVTTDSYFGSSAMKMLVGFGDRTDPRQFEIRRALTRDQNGVVTEMPVAMIQFMRSTFQPVLDSMAIRWDALPQQDTTVVAGTFAGCYHGRSGVAAAGHATTSEVWWHPEVPINGVVKMVGVGEPTSTELIDFGDSGAQSTF